MKKTSRRFTLPLAALALTAAFGASRIVAATPMSNATLARRALSSDPTAARTAITLLRKQGPAGLQALLTVCKADIARHDTVLTSGGTASVTGDPKWRRITAALDAVARQRDSQASQLYWYTDLAEAKRAAKASGKPILSLRLLGNLDEELSCANSRFFRTALYPNTLVSGYLRAHYILHWKSVRPVPTFTLDFGDGRKIVRTLTGNSIHYVLDSRGRTVDALPGLYGPQAFLRHLAEDEKIARESTALTDEAADRRFLSDWHQAQYDALAAAWAADCTKAYGERRAPTLATLIAPIGSVLPDGSAPGALRAAPLAIGKSFVERPIVSALSASNMWAVSAPSLEWGWDQIGQIHAADAVLDASSRALIADKHPDLSRIPILPQPGTNIPSGFGGFGAPEPTEFAPPQAAMATLIQNFERAMAQDSVRNEYVYHARLHQWFTAGLGDGDLETLNQRVYANLFLTPDKDPWLGLSPSGAYTALPGDGLVGKPLPAVTEPAGKPAVVAAATGGLR